MRRRLPWTLGIVAVVLLAAFLVWQFAFRDTTTPVSASEAVQGAMSESPGEVQPATPAATTPGPGATEAPTSVPLDGVGSGFLVGDEPGDPGLYVYATTGFEEIDALGGAHHDYPAETFLSLQPGGCGTVVRWTALKERWDQEELCPTEEGLGVALSVAYHEWFGRSDIQEYTCDASVALAIPTSAEGSWTYTCGNDARTQRVTVQVVGSEELLVNGDALRVVHVRVTTALTGGSVGSGRTDTWYLEGTALVVRRVVSGVSVNDSLIGPVHYKETYEINLVSPTPKGAADEG